MTVDPVACPYCNAFVIVAPGAATRQKMLCPRCGETFTYLRPERPGSSDLQTMPTTTAPSAPEIETSPAGRYLLARRANRFVAAIVLGVMFLMATVGLTFALWTQKDRRAHDIDLGKKPRRF